jgi:hypothetical protein
MCFSAFCLLLEYFEMLSDVNTFNVCFITFMVHEAHCAVRVTSYSSLVSCFVFFPGPALRVSVPEGLRKCTPVHSGGRRRQSLTGGLIFACVPETTADS